MRKKLEAWKRFPVTTYCACEHWLHRAASTSGVVHQWLCSFSDRGFIPSHVRSHTLASGHTSSFPASRWPRLLCSAHANFLWVQFYTWNKCCLLNILRYGVLRSCLSFCFTLNQESTLIIRILQISFWATHIIFFHVSAKSSFNQSIHLRILCSVWLSLLNFIIIIIEMFSLFIYFIFVGLIHWHELFDVLGAG